MPLTVDYLEKTSAAGTHPGRLLQARGAHDRGRGAHLAPHRSPVASAVPQGLALRHAGDRHGRLDRSRERLRRAGDDRRLDGAAPVATSPGPAPTPASASAASTASSSSTRPSPSARQSDLDLHGGRQPRRHRDGRRRRRRGQRGRHRRRADVRPQGGAAAHRPAGEAAGRGRQAEARVRAAGEGPGDRRARSAAIANQKIEAAMAIRDKHERYAALDAAGAETQGRPGRDLPGPRRRGRRGLRVGQEEAPARAGAQHRRAASTGARPADIRARSPARSACCRARTARRCSRAARRRRW